VKNKDFFSIKKNAFFKGLSASAIFSLKKLKFHLK